MFPTHTCKDNCIKKVLDQSRQLLFQTDKELTDHAVLRLIHLKNDQHLISPYSNAAGSKDHENEESDCQPKRL